jgi:cysteine-rich repeat protein
MSRNLHRLILLALLTAPASCSTLTKDADNCVSDEQCVEAFGMGASCDSSGFCSQPEELLAADICSSPDVPVVTSSSQPVRIDTSKLSDKIRDLASCTEFQALGNDAFFAVDMEAGEKWHFHASIVGEQANPAVYVLRSCDERTCQVGDAIDDCNDGFDEHLSFSAPTTSRYFIGIDSREAGGEVYDVLALSPVCGDSILDHSETCDDGNLVANDGCDERCRFELAPASPSTLTFELEPNDDFTSANYVQPEAIASQVKISGRLGGRCDFDIFVIDVPEGGSLQAEMFEQQGVACTTSTEFNMTLLDSSGVRNIGDGTVKSGTCPSLDASNAFSTGLTAGLYYVRVTTDSTAQSIDYELHLSVLAAP